MIDTLIVLAKRPIAGRVKTRLVPPLTFAHAAELASAALSDTLDVVTRTTSRAKLLAFDGASDGWLRPGWQSARQSPGGLDRRLGAAFLAAGPGPAVLVGMDTPHLRRDQLGAFDPSRYDACLGRALDGGYWAIGFRDPRLAPAAIEGIPMSTNRTGAEQLDRLTALGLRVQILDDMVDVDTISDAELVADVAPTGAFAAALRRIRAPQAKAS